VRSALVVLTLAAPLAVASDSASIPAFSAQGPREGLPAPWRELVPPRARAAGFSLVDDAGVTVLRVRSHAAAGAASYALHADAGEHPILAWRWKIDRVVAGADLAAKSGDDFAARVYVFFDVPASELGVGARVRLALARLFYGATLPGAAICYVWDNRHPAGTAAWSAYTDRVRMVVLESGDGRAGQWAEERRDLVADYRAAFGANAVLHDVSGIAAGNDTDQTGASATAWFGDFRLEPRGAR